MPPTTSPQPADRDSWPIIDGVAIPPESEWCRSLSDCPSVGDWVFFNSGSYNGTRKFASIENVTRANGGTIHALGTKFCHKGFQRARDCHGIGPRIRPIRSAAEAVAFAREEALWDIRTSADEFVTSNGGTPSSVTDAPTAAIQRAAALLREAAEVLKGKIQ